MDKISLKAPFSGKSPVLEITAEKLFNNLNRKLLYKSRWKTSGNGPELLSHLLEDKSIFAAIRARAVYGYFPVFRKAEGLCVNERFFWPFARIKKQNIMERFSDDPQSPGILPLLTVSLGHEITNLLKQYHLLNDYTEYFLLHGLAAEFTETLAAYLQNLMNDELHVSATLRRSFGHPGLPGLSYQKDLIELLKAGRIDVALTEYHQLVPEFSVTAMLIPLMNERNNNG